MRIAWGFVITVLVFTTSACASGLPPGPTVWVSPTCPLPKSRSGAIPEDFQVSWVLQCVYPVSYSTQGDNPKSMRADGPAADLVAALRKPSDPPWNGACVDGFRSISTFALVDDSGRAVIPFVPVDGCRIPQNGVYAALDALRFRPI